MSGAIPPPDERDDDELLRRLVDGQPIDGPRTPEREAYEDLIERIRDLPDLPPPDGWEERLEAKRADHERAARRQRLLRRAVPATFAVLTAAAAVLIYVKTTAGTRSRADEATNDFVVETGPGPTTRAEDTAKVGDTLMVTVSRPESHVELRIYRGADEVLRCPGDAGCWAEPRPERNATVRFKPTVPGAYRAIVIVGTKPIPAGSKNMDVALSQLGPPDFHVEVRSPIDVH